MNEFEGNPGTGKLARVLSRRMNQANAFPLVLDFGEIQGNGSLLTNTFPVPIPKGDYSICRQLTLGKAGGKFSCTDEEPPEHTVRIPDKMRSAGPGDRVLVAWVQNEAVVVDIIEQS